LPVAGTWQKPSPRFGKDQDLKQTAYVVVQLCARVDALEAKLKSQKIKEPKFQK
jgi:hypothetical protein